MKYCELKTADIANGLGIRITIFVSGCEHYCKDCFNQEAWNFDYGQDFEANDLENVLSLVDKSYVTGLTILGKIIA